MQDPLLELQICIFLKILKVAIAVFNEISIVKSYNCRYC